jgi:hypothetical protein
LTVFVEALTEVMPSPVRLYASEAGSRVPQFTGTTLARFVGMAAVDTPAATSAAAHTTASTRPCARIPLTLMPSPLPFVPP